MSHTTKDYASDRAERHLFAHENCGPIVKVSRCSKIKRDGGTVWDNRYLVETPEGSWLLRLSLPKALEKATHLAGAA